jgi:hypothetical protein
MKKSDIVWHHDTTGETQVWYMDGNTLLTRGTVLGSDGNPALVGPPFRIVGVGDMDGNGKADIVWHHDDTGETQVWFMDGNTLMNRGTVVGSDGNPALVGPPFRIVGVGEFGIPKPERPTDLRVTGVADREISISWIDQSTDENGFSIRFRGIRAGFDDHTGRKIVGRNEVSASLSGLRSGFQYTMTVVAFNDAGESEASNAVQATTPARFISVSKEGTGSSTVFVVTGAGFTPSSLVIVRIADGLSRLDTFPETAGRDGTFVSPHAYPCVSGTQFTFTAYEDADPDGTFANSVVTTCP